MMTTRRTDAMNTVGMEQAGQSSEAVPALHAGVYGRESKAKMASIENQLDLGRQAVADHNWTLVDEYEDGGSASRFGRKPRKGWKRLLVDLDAGLLDIVAVWEASRADRDIETWVPFVVKCRTKGVMIYAISDDEILDPNNISHFRRLIEAGLDATVEAEKISRRVTRGVLNAAVEGHFHGYAAYGYTRLVIGEVQTKRGPKTIRKQVPDPAEAPIVVEVISRIARGDAIKAIVDDLNHRGVPSPRGGNGWVRFTVRAMCLNVVYLGQRKHKGVIREGTWAPLVKEDIFRAAGVVLRDPKRKTTQPGAVRWLLSNIATSPCGATCSVSPKTGTQDPVLQCSFDGCVSTSAYAAEEYVARTIVRRLAQPDSRDLFQVDDEPAMKAQDEAATLRAQLTEAIESYELPWIDGKPQGLSSARMAAIEQRLQPLIEDADRRSVSTVIPLELLKLVKIKDLTEEIIRPWWDDLPIGGKREIVRLMFDEVRVGHKLRRLGRWSTPEQKFESAAERMTFRWHEF